VGIIFCDENNSIQDLNEPSQQMNWKIICDREAIIFFSVKIFFVLIVTL